MKTIQLILLLAFALTTHLSTAQIATIIDADGWTNVRKEANNNSEVIYKVREGQLFWYDFEFDFQNSTWVEVIIPEDKYCTNGYEGNSIVGYVHKSRLVQLDSLETYKAENFEFRYYTSDFDSTGRHITYHDNKWPIKIDNVHIWGTDGYFPSNQIDSISIRLDGRSITIEPELYDDLFNIREDIKLYRISDFYIVYNRHGDGAGSYEIGWTIDKEGNIIQRLVGSSI